MIQLVLLILLTANAGLVLSEASHRSQFIEKPLPLITNNKINTNDWNISSGWYNNGCKLTKNYVKIIDEKITIHLDKPFKKNNTVYCGELQSKKFYGYGKYELNMKTVKGNGLNTAFFLYTGPGLKQPIHDEIDFEFLGRYPGTVDLNHWKNGVTALPKRIILGFDPSKDFHTYTIEWLPGKIKWYVDNRLVHETTDETTVPTEKGLIYINLWSSIDKFNLEDWMGKYVYKGRKTMEINWFRYQAYKTVD